jgi:hypothetical protein
VAARNNALTLTFCSGRAIVFPRAFDPSRRRLSEASPGPEHLRRRCGVSAKDGNDGLNKVGASRRADYISIALGVLNGCLIAAVWGAVWLLF